MARTPAQKIADAWEQRIEKLFGGRIRVGSGNQWFAKLDVKIGGGWLISAKATKAESFRVNDDMLREMRSLRNRPGGEGANVKMALMVKTAKHEVVVMELDDFMELIVDPDIDIEEIPRVLAKSPPRSRPQLFRVDL